MTWRRSAVILSLAVAGLVTVSPATAGAQPAPSASTVPSAAPGDFIDVVGAGWPAAAVINVQVCGRQATRGSADCDLLSQRSVGSRGDGQFGIRLKVTAPPTPCPCVVLVTSAATTRTVALPIEIVGAPSAEVTLPEERLNPARVVLRTIAVRRTGGPAEWFGARPARVAEIGFVHAGFTAPQDVTITLLSGDRELARRTIRVVAGRQSGSVEVPFELDALSLGRTGVRATTAGLPAPSSIVTETTVWPWGLAATALVVLQLALLGVRNRLRRRFVVGDDAPRVPIPPAAAKDRSDAPDVVVDVVDVVDVRESVLPLSEIEALASRVLELESENVRLKEHNRALTRAASRLLRMTDSLAGVEGRGDARVER